jgi:alkylation response protein AidB-like acyl-CoA dehydrogenase
VEDIRSTASTCLGDMQAAFEAAMSAQQQRSSQVQAALDTYLQRKTADLATLQVPTPRKIYSQASAL